MPIALSLAAILTSWVLLHLGVEPVPTWFYVFAWYPTLVLMDALASRLDGRPSMLWRRPMLLAFLWSPVVWFVFEVANFRLQNWYYVFLPHSDWARWSGIVLSFATVVPAVLLAENLLAAAGLFRRGKGPALTVRTWELGCSIAAGVLMAVLALVFPRTFFPLIWGAVFLLVDPLLFVFNRTHSLLGDLEKGYWGRIGRLMAGGLCIGLIWEGYNYWARSKWIYTVPWLEELKLFEMPPFGFVGFPVFALEAWSMYAGLCLLGVATPLVGAAKFYPKRFAIAVSLGAVFSALTIVGMERRTISSTVPRLSDIPGAESIDLGVLESHGVRDVFDLARSDPSNLSPSTGLPLDAIDAAITSSRLATLRGIGHRHVETLSELGVGSVCVLARQDPNTLLERIRGLNRGERPNGAEIRVWIRAAKRACDRTLD